MKKIKLSNFWENFRDFNARLSGTDVAQQFEGFIFLETGRPKFIGAYESLLDYILTNFDVIGEKLDYIVEERREILAALANNREVIKRALYSELRDSMFNHVSDGWGCAGFGSYTDYDTFKSEIHTETDVRYFFKFLMYDRGLGAGFHPDSSLEDYQGVFVGDEAERYDALVERCFEVCETEGLDVYDIGMELMKPFLPDGFFGGDAAPGEQDTDPDYNPMAGTFDPNYDPNSVELPAAVIEMLGEKNVPVSWAKRVLLNIEQLTPEELADTEYVEDRIDTNLEDAQLKFDDVRLCVHDGSGIENRNNYYWVLTNGIWYPGDPVEGFNPEEEEEEEEMSDADLADEATVRAEGVADMLKYFSENWETLPKDANGRVGTAGTPYESSAEALELFENDEDYVDELVTFGLGFVPDSEDTELWFFKADPDNDLVDGFTDSLGNIIHMSDTIAKGDDMWGDVIGINHNTNEVTVMLSYDGDYLANPYKVTWWFDDVRAYEPEEEQIDYIFNPYIEDDHLTVGIRTSNDTMPAPINGEEFTQNEPGEDWYIYLNFNPGEDGDFSDYKGLNVEWLEDQKGWNVSYIGNFDDNMIVSEFYPFADSSTPIISVDLWGGKEDGDDVTVTVTVDGRQMTIEGNLEVEENYGVEEVSFVQNTASEYALSPEDQEWYDENWEMVNKAVDHEFNK